MEINQDRMRRDRLNGGVKIELLSSTEAREFLSLDGKPMGKTTFEHHISKGRIEVDFMSGKYRFFSKERLEVAKKAIRDEENYTLKELASMCGKSRKSLRYHFHKKRNIEPVGRRGHSATYSLSALQMVAKSEGWDLQITTGE